MQLSRTQQVALLQGQDGVGRSLKNEHQAYQRQPACSRCRTRLDREVRVSLGYVDWLGPVHGRVEGGGGDEKCEMLAWMQLMTIFCITI